MLPSTAFRPVAEVLLTTVVLSALLGGCRSDEPTVAESSEDRVGAVAVLRAWDRARSRAFAEGDVRALRRLYVPGSTAGTTDVELLRDYLRRGLRVRGLRMQLLAVDVLDRRGARLRVRVTDRVARAVAVGEGSRTVLPRDRASTRIVGLRRDDAGRWRVAVVSAA